MTTTMVDVAILNLLKSDMDDACRKAKKVKRALGGDLGVSGDELRVALESFNNQGKYGFQRAGSLRLSHFDGVDDVVAIIISHFQYLSALCFPSWLILQRDASLSPRKNAVSQSLLVLRL